MPLMLALYGLKEILNNIDCKKAPERVLKLIRELLFYF